MQVAKCAKNCFCPQFVFWIWQGPGVIVSRVSLKMMSFLFAITKCQPRSRKSQRDAKLMRHQEEEASKKWPLKKLEKKKPRLGKSFSQRCVFPPKLEGFFSSSHRMPVFAWVNIITGNGKKFLCKKSFFSCVLYWRQIQSESLNICRKKERSLNFGKERDFCQVAQQVLFWPPDKEGRNELKQREKHASRQSWNKPLFSVKNVSCGKTQFSSPKNCEGVWNTINFSFGKPRFFGLFLGLSGCDWRGVLSRERRWEKCGLISNAIMYVVKSEKRFVRKFIYFFGDFRVF